MSEIQNMFSLPAMSEVTGNSKQVVDYALALAFIAILIIVYTIWLVGFFWCLFNEPVSLMWHLIFKIKLNHSIRCANVRYTYVSLVGIHQLALVQKRTLVINLDILIDSMYIQLGSQRLMQRGVPHDFIVHVPNYEGNMVIYKRPGLDFCLKMLSEWYHLVIFSVSNVDYAKGILDVLDNDGRIRYIRIYGRRSRTHYGQHAILVDNIVTAECCSMVNTIFVKKYFVGNWDTALMTMLYFLYTLRYVEDIRVKMRRGRLIL